MARTIDLHADYFDRGGWGNHARAFGNALVNAAADTDFTGTTRQTSTEVKLIPTNPQGSLVWTHPALCSTAGGSKSIALGSVSMISAFNCKNCIFCTVWETSEVPANFVKALRHADQIWVPTTWGKEIFLRAGLSESRIAVVPEGVDTVRFSPPVEARQRNRLRFVCVGKWEERKGQTLLLDAFCNAFSATDDVELIMHCHNPYLPGFSADKTIRNYVNNRYPNPPRILTTDYLNENDYVNLLQSSDVFVLPTRAEGWGLPILEAMACGVPAIVTNYSAHLVFANRNNSWLIDVDCMCKVTDNRFFDQSLQWGHWAQPSHDHLVSLLLESCHNRTERKRKATNARATALAWTWHSAAIQAHRCLIDSNG